MCVCVRFGVGGAAGNAAVFLFHVCFAFEGVLCCVPVFVLLCFCFDFMYE